MLLIVVSTQESHLAAISRSLGTVVALAGVGVGWVAAGAIDDRVVMLEWLVQQRAAQQFARMDARALLGNAHGTRSIYGNFQIL